MDNKSALIVIDMQNGFINEASAQCTPFCLFLNARNFCTFDY